MNNAIPASNDCLTAATTAPEILAAIISGLNQPDSTAATIDEIIDLIPPFDHNRHFTIANDILDIQKQHLQKQNEALRMLRQPGFSDVDVSDLDSPALDQDGEPDNWMEKTAYRLARVIEAQQNHYSHAVTSEIIDMVKTGKENDSRRRTHAAQLLDVAKHVPPFPTMFLALFHLEASDPLPGKPTFIEALQSAHALWKEVESRHPGEFKHPLAPLVEECLKTWKPKVEPETRPRQILPKALDECRSVAQQGELFPIGTFPRPSETLWLPGFEPSSTIIPALPLEFYRATGAPENTPGGGARLSMRMWFYCIAATPLEDRTTQGRKLNTTLRLMKDWVYPNGWERKRHLPMIRQAMIEMHNHRITWKGTDRSLVVVFDLPPLDADLDCPLDLAVVFPDGMSPNGPMINMTVLSELGVKSAPKFRAWLRLAYIWDDAKKKNGGHRIYAQRPEVLRNNRRQPTDRKGNILSTRDWNHKNAVWTGDFEANPAAERVPVLNDDEMIRLFYDDKQISSTAKWKRLERARRDAEEMECDGLIVIRKEKRGWRLLEPYRNTILGQDEHDTRSG